MLKTLAPSGAVYGTGVRRTDLPALRLTEASPWARRCGRLTVFLLLATPALLLLAPWQQTSRGKGEVVAFNPLDREQFVEAPIAGVIVEWYVQEGSHVEAGDPLLRVQDNDPRYMEQLQDNLESLQTKLDAYLDKVAAYRRNVEFVTLSMESAIQAKQEAVEAAEQKILNELAGLEAALAARSQAELQYERSKFLFEQGIDSRQQMEIDERKWREEVSKVKQAEAKIQEARELLQEKTADLRRTREEYQGKIEKELAELSAAQAEVAETEKEVRDLEVAIARQGLQIVVAPRAGKVLRLEVAQNAQQISKGDKLLVLVPETESRAVQMYIRGMDVPLVQPGRKVRLQFDGWPALQFAGWPSVAVGTFGGQVALVDATDNATGEFRIVVLPDPDDPEPWPTGTYLRQGTRTNGWVLLDQVSLGYELWRQLNGFPPTVTSPSDKLPKPPLPK